MAGGEMFGAPAGISQKLQDTTQEALGASKIMETAGELSMLPFKAANYQALTRFHQAQSQKLEEESAKNKRIAELLAQGGLGGPGEDPADMLDRVGMTHVKGGAFKDGRELINSASQLRSRAQAAETNAARSEFFLSRVEAEAAKRLSSRAGAVRDQAGYEDFLARSAEDGLIDVSKMPRDFRSAQPILGQMAEEGMTLYQRKRLSQHDANLELRERESGRQSGERGSREMLRETQRLLAEERIRKLQRDAGAGPKGTVVGAPSKNELTQAGTSIKELGLKMDTPTDLAMFGQTVAAEAKALTRRNKGLDYQTAVNQVLVKAQTDGSLQEVSSFGGMVKKQKFVGGGKSPLTALPPPAKGQQPIMGRYYRDANGRVGKATPNGAELVDVNLLDDEEDDE